jgi:hypothetical protein
MKLGCIKGQGMMLRKGRSIDDERRRPHTSSRQPVSHLTSGSLGPPMIATSHILKKNLLL